MSSIRHKGWKWSTKDASNPTLVMVLDDTSKTVHICDASDQDTDWALSAASHPTVCVHSATTPATEYMKMYHDATNAYIDGVGAASMQLQIAGTTALTVRAAAFTEGTPALEMTTTNASVHASTSAEYFLMSNTQSGAAGVGGRARFYTSITAAMGSWSNALKAHVVYSNTGSTSGMGSAFCAELELSTGTTSGTYAPLESEVVIVSGDSLGTATSFLYMNTSGTGKASFDTSGYLFELGAGMTPASGKIIYDHQGTDPTNSEGSLRFRLPSGASAYLMYYDAQAA